MTDAIERAARARWEAMKTETTERIRPILESLRRADGGYPEGVAVGPSVQDLANGRE